MDIVNNFILPLLVLAVGAACTFLWHWGRKRYNEIQNRITNLELRLHKREISVKLGGLFETSPWVKDFFSAYDFLYIHGKNKNAEQFIEVMDARLAPAYQNVHEHEHIRVMEGVISDAEELGYKRKSNKEEVARNLYKGE